MDETTIDETEPAQTETSQDDTPTQEMKMLSMNETLEAVSAAVWEATDRAMNRYPSQVMVYDAYAIVRIGMTYYRVPYQVLDGRVVLPLAEDWEKVEQAWIEAKLASDLVVIPGDAVKALGSGVIGGHLVRFTDENDLDLSDTRDFFDAATEFGPHRKTLVFYDHGLDDALGLKHLGGVNYLADLKLVDTGVWIQTQLDLADEYEAAVYELAKRGRLGWSAGTAGHLVKRTPVKTGGHHIDTWLLGLDASLTVRPAAGPEKTQAIPLKTYMTDAQPPSLKALVQELKASQTNATPSKPGATAGVQPAAETGNRPSKKEIPMDPEELKNMITGAVAAAVAPIQQEVSGLKAALASEPATNGAGHQTTSPDAQADKESEKKRFNALYALKFSGKGDEEVKGVVLDELAAGNYRQLVWEQNRAFAKYLRYGGEELDRQEKKLLRTQIFAPVHVMGMIKDLEIAEIKDVMVEAQGTLGGYAVPPNVQEAIIMRLPGLTAVRGNGATVITLTRGNSVEAPLYSGGNDRYRGNLRGQWGGETQDPDEQNAKLQQVSLVADIYTYKIPMSQSLVEDAANLVDLVQTDITDTLSMDEDTAFLIGDGAGKPLGFLPGGLNAMGLKEVNSGAAAAMTTSGVKKLKRGIASQYRGRGAYVGNSDTYGDIELLTVSGTGSNYAFPDLADSGLLLRRPAAESGAMPDVAANSFPLLYADMGAYWIVEKPGMTIVRFQDSKTGINKVEFHVRKRVGGRLVELWRAAVQKVAE
ncbi:MAG: phage major capsid protein [Anaerolinea sp.]|nr:phage major capsid protein [Anaerolinea sp.]